MREQKGQACGVSRITMDWISYHVKPFLLSLSDTSCLQSHNPEISIMMVLNTDCILELSVELKKKKFLGSCCCSVSKSCLTLQPHGL